MQPWIIIVLILIALIVLGMISSFFGSLAKGIKAFLIISLWLFKLALEALYLILVYWWLYLIRKERGETLPNAWMFSKKNDDQ
ncbi:MAG: hypothetical protein WCR56_04320 [Bacilli bacterium]|jgi:type II secretory pathway pseudopilin PulG